jgi:hypothetical protein
MTKERFEEFETMFSDGSGFGDPAARRNAELRLQILLAKQQSKTASRLNWLTGCLVAVGLMQVAVLLVSYLSRQVMLSAYSHPLPNDLFKPKPLRGSA